MALYRFMGINKTLHQFVNQLLRFSTACFYTSFQERQLCLELQYVHSNQTRMVWGGAEKCIKWTVYLIFLRCLLPLSWQRIYLNSCFRTCHLSIHTEKLCQWTWRSFELGVPVFPWFFNLGDISSGLLIVLCCSGFCLSVDKQNVVSTTILKRSSSIYLV